MAETRTPWMISAATNLNLRLVESGTFGRRRDAFPRLTSQKIGALFTNIFLITWNVCLCFWLGQKRREQWRGRKRVAT